MTEELQEIKERLEQLERYVNLLESRLDAQAGTQAGAQDAAGARLGEDDPRIRGFDQVLRSILTRQGMQNTALRSVVRGLERLQSSMEKVIEKITSIEEALRGADGNGLASGPSPRNSPKCQGSPLSWCR